jgi:DNA invertase Pin-like site-specific DNA recombinase
MKYAAAYIRRSSVSGDSPGDASREAQLAAVRGLCGEDVTVYADWGISGQKDNRPDYVRLKGDILAGNVASVCAYSLSRLGRSARELLTFVDLCTSKGVTIRTSVESLDTSSAMGRAMLTVMAAFAQLEADVARERQVSAREARQRRGDDMSAPYGWKLERQPDGSLKRVPDPDERLDKIREAYEQAGSVLGACNLLQDWGIVAPRGGTEWATSMVTRTIEREWPEILPQRTAVGRRSPTRKPAMFAHLLRCPFTVTDKDQNEIPCGRMLTPNLKRGQYYCAQGRFHRRTHPRYAVREDDLKDWMIAEADRLEVPFEEVALEGTEAREAALGDQLARAKHLFVVGDLTTEQYDAEKSRITKALDDIRGEASVAAIPEAVDWDNWPAERVNRALRGIWREVRLDANLLAIEAEWRVPEWRA